jgi:hypothetical protein
MEQKYNHIQLPKMEKNDGGGGFQLPQKSRRG